MRASKQRGMSLTGVVFTVFLVGFFLTVGFKLGPHYLDNNVIQGAIDQVGLSGLDGKSEREVRSTLSNFFTINNVRDIDTDQVELVRGKNGTKLVLDYEKRVEMFGNVDVVLKFHNEFDSAKQDK